LGETSLEDDAALIGLETAGLTDFVELFPSSDFFVIAMILFLRKWI
jgi:hypothetical protein